MIHLTLFLTYILSILTITSSHVLLQTATGEVSRGNFIYWSLNYHGNIVIQLISLSGDADLYVSERIAKPDYEPEKYDLHAASCGVDVVHIPNSFKRPIGIGVYGHPSYENSTYLLEILYDTEIEEYVDYEKENQEFVEFNSNGENSDEVNSNFKLSRGMIISGFWAVMEILELLFS